MQTYRAIAIIASTLLAFGASAAEKAISRTVPVDSTFIDGGMSWDGRPSYEMKWKLIIVDGKIEICGAGAHFNAQAKRHTRKVLGGYRVVVDGQTVLKDLRYFTDVKRKRDLPKATAKCRATGFAAPSKRFRYGLEADPSRARF